MRIIDTIINDYIIRNYGWKTYIIYIVMSMLIVLFVGIIIMIILRVKENRKIKSQTRDMRTKYN